MNGAQVSTLITVLVATGLLTAISETVRWYLTGRGRAKIDNAKVVQGMALDLLQPLHQELATANASMLTLKAHLKDLEAELESVLGWALIARALLDHHHIEYPDVPKALAKRMDPPHRPPRG